MRSFGCSQRATRIAISRRPSVSAKQPSALCFGCIGSRARWLRGRAAAAIFPPSEAMSRRGLELWLPRDTRRDRRGAAPFARAHPSRRAPSTSSPLPGRVRRPCVGRRPHGRRAERRASFRRRTPPRTPSFRSRSTSSPCRAAPRASTRSRTRERSSRHRCGSSSRFRLSRCRRTRLRGSSTRRR